MLAVGSDAAMAVRASVPETYKYAKTACNVSANSPFTRVRLLSYYTCNTLLVLARDLTTLTKGRDYDVRTTGARNLSDWVRNLMR